MTLKVLSVVAAMVAAEGAVMKLEESHLFALAAEVDLTLQVPVAVGVEVALKQNEQEVGLAIEKMVVKSSGLIGDSGGPWAAVAVVKDVKLWPEAEDSVQG
ncbi:hypothetical protein CRG98_031265 [Punica granatum]|uniref:Uncharacterized protein n=1 Tax=Punica granatum TaxID=22663 RepID=A0A2I0IWD9_PUNGR|nr:hypothetical protein CRG98_031265 [Punica granatum]